ncbi:hypothetical protein BVY03_03825 [bacterium K02(2017)]|nr:hypothetical protein BVY03_03825 [bacterium K02(2017)]
MPKKYIKYLFLQIAVLLLFTHCTNTIKIAALECDRLESATERSRCKESKMGGTSTGFYLNKADKKIEKGDVYGSINDLNKAIKANPKSLTATYRKALMLSRLGQTGNAIKTFDQVIKMNPKHADAHYYKAITLHEIHQYKEAVESFNSAIAIRPNYASAHFEKAKLLIDLRREAQALESYLSAYKIWKRKLKYNPDYFKIEKGTEANFKKAQKYLFAKGMIVQDKLVIDAKINKKETPKPNPDLVKKNNN